LVLTIGGSYPGWLSAMMRIRYPAVVDFSYSASAPMRFYSQEVDQYAYYGIISKSAEDVSGGCSSAVQKMLMNTIAEAGSKDVITQNLQLCTPLPIYIQNQPLSTLVNEINMIVMYSFANLNMANYPPPNTALLAACLQIQNGVQQGDYWNSLRTFLVGNSFKLAHSTLQIQFYKNFQQCYNLSLQLPAGHDATISSGDWSGVGSGTDGANWDFQTSTLLVESIGVNGISDMFLPRPWSLDWLNNHAKVRFNVNPQPNLLRDLWGFQDLQKIGATHIIFTNGLKDGWSAGGVRKSLPEQEIYVLDMPNGAHHSDLLHEIISNDTPDVLQVRQVFEKTLSKWVQSQKK